MDRASIIARTTSKGKSADEFEADYTELKERWGAIRDLTLRSTAPALIHIPPAAVAEDD